MLKAKTVFHPNDYEHNDTTGYAIKVNGNVIPIYKSYDKPNGMYVYTIKDNGEYYVVSDSFSSNLGKENIENNLKKIQYGPYPSSFYDVYKISNEKETTKKETTSSTNSIFKQITDQAKAIIEGKAAQTNGSIDYTKTVGTITMNGTDTPIYTDGKGGYYYINGNSTVKLTDAQVKFLSGKIHEPVPINSSNNSNNSNSSNSSNSSTTNYLSSSLGGLTDVGVDRSEIDAIKANQPKLMSAAELAELYGLKYDYDYILGVLNEGTEAYLNEMTEKAKRIQQDTLRNQVGLYYQYLEALREQRANAVNSGINRGTMAAQELSQYLMSQQQITNALSESNANIYDLYNQAITEKAKNKYTALQDYNQLGTSLMNGSVQLNANDIQRYAADLGAAAQIASANAAAKAQVNSSRVNAQAQVDAANINNAYTNSILNNPFLYNLYIQSLQDQAKATQAQANYYNSQSNYYNTQANK
jgi:hypothetical protein